MKSVVDDAVSDGSGNGMMLINERVIERLSDVLSPDSSVELFHQHS